jgi:general secretion pathway protein C
MVTVDMLRISGLVRAAQAHVLTQQRLTGLLELGLVIVLAVLVVDLVMELVSGQSMPQAEISATLLSSPSTFENARPGNDTNRPSTKLKALFGLPPVTSVGITQLEEELKETQLNLKLKGILVNSLSGIGLALIAGSNNVEEIYQVGDEIEGAEIVRIEPRRVVLKRNGTTEALNLEVSRLETDQVDNAVRNPRFSRNGIRKISDNQRVMSQRSLRQQLDNLPRLLQQARAVPHTVNGQSMGFKLVDIQAGSLFEDLGLEREDVIQSVNGTRLRTPQDALKAYRDLRTSKSFQVALIRSGRAMTLNLSVQ